MQRTYRHKEAFCLMKYATEDGSEVEWIWNSRDGVTPFCVANRAGDKVMTHVDWHLDRRILNYQPRPGERVFVSLTAARAIELATRRVEEHWDRGEYPICKMFATKEAAIADFTKHYNIGQDPMLVMAAEIGQ